MGQWGLWSWAASAAWGPPPRLRSSRAPFSLPPRRWVSDVNDSIAPRPPSTGDQRRTSARGWRPGTRPRAAAPTPKAFSQFAPAQCSRARSRSWPARRERTRAGTCALRGEGAEGVSGGGGAGGGGGRVASRGARACPRARPPPHPSPARVKRFLPACSGRRDLIPRWRTARMSTILKRAAFLFSIQR